MGRGGGGGGGGAACLDPKILRGPGLEKNLSQPNRLYSVAEK